jgi:hypothetical protein
MDSTTQEFEKRMRRDRAFRERILAASKAGNLPETLEQEGYDLSLLEVHLPQVRTGLHGGQCYCII